MKSFKHYLTASTGLILFISVVALSLPQTGHSSYAADKDVRVINLPTEAVPVVTQGTTTISGNVSVINTPTVKSQQNGAWSVGIAGTPAVSVMNNTSGPLVVRDIDRPTAQPFQTEVTVQLDPGEGGANEFVTVPTGKMLVIEQVSAYAAASTDQLLEFSLLTRIQPDNTLRLHRLTSDSILFGGANQYTVSQLVKIYAGPGVYGARVSRNGGNDIVIVRYNISGYYVDNQP